MSFLEEAKNWIPSAVNQNLDRMNERQKSLIPAFFQYRILEEQRKLTYQTWVLTIATWVLAITTVIIAIITFFKGS